jgi:hypothetical protein
MEAGVIVAWSIRDILAQVTTWEEEALKHLPLILRGGTPPRYFVRYMLWTACLRGIRQMCASTVRRVDSVDCGPPRTSDRQPQRVYSESGSTRASLLQLSGSEDRTAQHPLSS